MDLQELILQYKKTKNNTLLDNAIRMLKPFIYKHTARLSRILPLEFDDIQQEVSIAILKRVESYDSSKGKFLTYLTNTFKGDPTDTLQTQVCKRRGGDGKSHYLIPDSLQNVINEEDSTTLEDVIEDKHDFRSEISFNLLHDLRDNLNETEGKVFDLLYSDSELSNFAISQTLHIPVNEVEKLRKVIRNKCKRRILNTNG